MRKLLLALLLLPGLVLGQQGAQIQRLPPALSGAGTEIVPVAQIGTSGAYTPPAICQGIYCGVGMTLNQIKAYVNGTGPVVVSGGGTGVATLTGIAKGNGTSPFTVAVSTDVLALWGGTCSSSTYLRGDGQCTAPVGTGTVTTTGSPANSQIAAFSGPSSITTATVANVLSLWNGTCSNTTFLRGDGSCQPVSGSVSSVGITADSWLTVTGSPITSSGTIALNAASQTGNLFLASPNGSPGVLAPRAIALGDLPLVPLTSQVSGILPVANGGSGAVTLTGLVKGNGASPFTAAASSDVFGLWTGTCSSSTFLRGDGACVAPSGSGTVTTTGSPANAQLAAFSGASSITTAVITGDLTCSGLACTVGSIGGNAVTLGGSLTTSGAHSVVFTTTGNTNVTLPTSGTLITNSVASLSSLSTVGTIGTGTWDGSIVQPTYGGTGVNNGSNTLTLGGSLTTSGAHSVVFTTTGNTNVTLPTSGTLITNSVASLSSLSTVGTIGTGTWDGSIVQPTYGGTGVNNGSNTLTLGGSLTTSGANALVLTTTGPTNVTLPTSGTLITNSVVNLTSLAAVGTITSGLWHGTLLGPSYGGTGVNNATNTLTLAQSSTFTSANGNIAPAQLQPSTQTGAYTFAASDCNAGDVLHYGTGADVAAIWTINAHATTAYPLGCTIVFDNEAGGGVITITPAAGVALTWNSGIGNGASGTINRTLAGYGTAVLHEMAQDSWAISGTASLQ